METKPLSQNSSQDGSASSLPLSAACVSDVGRVREGNEDSFYLGLNDGIFIVSDGMGGHQSGEVASRIVVENLPKILSEGLREAQKQTGTADYTSLIRKAIQDVNDLVNHNAMQEPGLLGMGATLALAWVTDPRGTVYLANIGDSRVYYYRNRTLNLLSRDHSIVALLIQQGEVSPEEAPTHPARGRLYRHIGMEGEALPEVHRIRMETGEKLLLCSDGLTDMLSDFRLYTLIDEQENLQDACRVMVDTANQQGGRDNITAMLLRWDNTV